MGKFNYKFPWKDFYKKKRKDKWKTNKINISQKLKKKTLEKMEKKIW